MEKLICPVCGAEFLRCIKASKTCSYDCSHKLVKRQPRDARYAKPKDVADFLTDMITEIRIAR